MNNHSHRVHVWLPRMLVEANETESGQSWAGLVRWMIRDGGTRGHCTDPGTVKEEATHQTRARPNG